MTEGKHTKTKIRDYAAEHGLSYTAARRALAAGGAAVDEQLPLTDIPCDLVDVFCEGGSAHPGRACWWWDLRNTEFAGASHLVRRSADLPSGRAAELYHRHPKFDYDPGYSGSWAGSNPQWLLPLVYAMLLSEQPELAPAWTALREAILADDLDAVDDLCEPLDLAAAALLDCDSDRWWGTVCPRIDAFADRVCPEGEHPGGGLLTAQGWTTVEPSAWFRGRRLGVWENRAVDLVRKHWRKAFAVYGHDSDGFPMRGTVDWTVPVHVLHGLRVARHGGFAEGTRVRLVDGRFAQVRRIGWAEGSGDGPASYMLSVESGRTDDRGRMLHEKGFLAVEPKHIAGPAGDDEGVDAARPAAAAVVVVQEHADAEYYDDGMCDDCSCCSRERCRRGPDSGCPTDSLGDSCCPCTEY